MHSEKVAKGQHALLPAKDYCHHCVQQGPALAHHRLELSHGKCPPLEPSLKSHLWSEDLPLPFPHDLEIIEDRTGNHNHHRRQGYMGPCHYTVSERCGPPCLWREVMAHRWEPWLPPSSCAWETSGLTHHGLEVSDRRVSSRLRGHSDCRCGREWHHHEQPHLFNGAPILAKVRSQRCYREARDVSEEHQLDCISENTQNTHGPGIEWNCRQTFGLNGHCERRHVTFKGYDDDDDDDDDDGHNIENNGQANPFRNQCNGAKTFFSTEVPQSKFTDYRTSGPKFPVRRETELCQAERSEVAGNWRKDRKIQGTVHDQIKKVVTDLEDVLCGLKQVQMEMKEVVQQIDVLTSNINLGEEEQGPSNGLPQEFTHRAKHQVVALVHNANTDSESTQRDITHAGVKSQTACFSADHSMAGVIFSCPDRHPTTNTHRNPSSCVHGLVTAQSAHNIQMNHTSALQLQKATSTTNGDCLQARPPSAKAKELQHPKSRTDHTKDPLAQKSLSKTHRPPPYPRNGLVKSQAKDSKVLKIPPYPGKQKQLTSTMV